MSRISTHTCMGKPLFRDNALADVDEVFSASDDTTATCWGDSPAISASTLHVVITGAPNTAREEGKQSGQKTC